MSEQNFECDCCGKSLSECENRRQVDPIVIRQILEAEIKSKCVYTERLAADKAYEAAAMENARREGISWALFVLSQKLGV
jgi:hypothetical protein